MVSKRRFNHTEIQILTFLGEVSLHVRALRRKLNDNGAVSRHLKHLQDLDLVKREKRNGWVVNTLTSKGKQLVRALNIVKF